MPIKKNTSIKIKIVFAAILITSIIFTNSCASFGTALNTIGQDETTESEDITDASTNEDTDTTENETIAEDENITDESEIPTETTVDENEPPINTTSGESNEDEISIPTIANTTEEFQTYAEFETSYTLGSWEIAVNSIEFTDEISENNFVSFKSDEGNLYIAVDMTITNKGKEAASFQDTFAVGDYVKIQLIYNSEYKYNPVYLLGYGKGLYNKPIQALSKKTGQIIFTIPELIKEDKDKSEIIFTYGKDKSVYTLHH